MHPRTLFTTFYFICNLQVGLVGQSITIHWAAKTCQRETLQLMGLIHQLQRKFSVVYTECDYVTSQKPGFLDCLSNIVSSLVYTSIESLNLLGVEREFSNTLSLSNFHGNIGLQQTKKIYFLKDKCIKLSAVLYIFFRSQ